jgi:ClpP class serine protease
VSFDTSGALSVLNWIIVIYILVQPILKQRMLIAGRLTVTREIEKKRGSRLISLIHRKEVVNFLGFPLVQYLDIQDSEAILRAIRLTPDDMPIDLIIHTPAGLNLSAEQIARALLRRKAKVTVFVPHYALSGGTLIALAADELVMCPDAILGALDPTINQFPAASVLSVAGQKSPELMSDNTYILVDQAYKAVRQMKQVVTLLLKKNMDGETAEKLADVLTNGNLTQDYPISVDEARDMGLPVKDDIPVEIYQYMNLFPQSTQQRPTVDYIPLPYPATTEK